MTVQNSFLNRILIFYDAIRLRLTGTIYRHSLNMAAQCPPGPIAPIGRPTQGGNVMLNMYFKKTDAWPKTKSADGKSDLSHSQIIDRSHYFQYTLYRARTRNRASLSRLL